MIVENVFLLSHFFKTLIISHHNHGFLCLYLYHSNGYLPILNVYLLYWLAKLQRLKRDRRIVF